MVQPLNSSTNELNFSPVACVTAEVCVHVLGPLELMKGSTLMNHL